MHFIQGTVNDNYMISKAAWADEKKRDCIVALLDEFFGSIELEVAQIGARVPVDTSIHGAGGLLQGHQHDGQSHDLPPAVAWKAPR
jgi:hypothetical protein